MASWPSAGSGGARCGLTDSLESSQSRQSDSPPEAFPNTPDPFNPTPPSQSPVIGNTPDPYEDSQSGLTQPTAQMGLTTGPSVPAQAVTAQPTAAAGSHSNQEMPPGEIGEADMEDIVAVQAALGYELLWFSQATAPAPGQFAAAYQDTVASVPQPHTHPQQAQLTSVATAQHVQHQAHTNAQQQVPSTVAWQTQVPCFQAWQPSCSSGSGGHVAAGAASVAAAAGACTDARQNQPWRPQGAARQPPQQAPGSSGGQAARGTRAQPEGQQAGGRAGRAKRGWARAEDLQTAGDRIANAFAFAQTTAAAAPEASAAAPTTASGTASGWNPHDLGQRRGQQTPQKRKGGKQSDPSSSKLPKQKGPAPSGPAAARNSASSSAAGAAAQGSSSSAAAAAAAQEDAEPDEGTIERRREHRQEGLNAIMYGKGSADYQEALRLVEEGLAPPDEFPVHPYAEGLGLDDPNNLCKKRAWEKATKQWRWDLKDFVAKYRQ